MRRKTRQDNFRSPKRLLDSEVLLNGITFMAEAWIEVAAIVVVAYTLCRIVA